MVSEIEFRIELLIPDTCYCLWRLCFWCLAKYMF